jgi:hypothetical protein
MLASSLVCANEALLTSVMTGNNRLTIRKSFLILFIASSQLHDLIRCSGFWPSGAPF